MPDGPLLVFGPRSTTYDLGTGHPLTPRRFGPGIELLRAVGADPGLAPEPAPDAALELCHDRAFIRAVRAASRDGSPDFEVGLGPGDTPAVIGLHEAAASVAGGSLDAIESILDGRVEHAFHPGGGLHHAMRRRASGFCVYNDPALAIARARQRGMRVLYVDLDVHHGDGVQALFWDDPGVLTFSIHESGRYLFPGTGSIGELGEGAAAGTAVNVPLQPPTGEQAWLAAVGALVPALAASFGPDVVVSQHGADSHAWDPLAHLRVTTTAMGEAARIVDRVAHRWAAGRWLATGGGGYDAYRVVPRAWTLTWLAGAHRDPPDEAPEAWRANWEGEAARYGQAPLPDRFADPPNAGLAFDGSQESAEAMSGATVALVRELAVPRLIRVAIDRGWWHPDQPVPSGSTGPGAGADRPWGAGHAEIRVLDARELERLDPAARMLPIGTATDIRAILVAAARAGALVVGAVVAGSLVGVGVALPSSGDLELLALGVAPEARRYGLGGRLLEGIAARARDRGLVLRLEVTVAERDPFEPLPAATRRAIASRLSSRVGLSEVRVPERVMAADPTAFAAIAPPRPNGNGPG